MKLLNEYKNDLKFLISKKAVLLVVLGVLAAVVLGCVQSPGGQSRIEPPEKAESPSESAAQQLKKFSSADEIKEYINANSQQSSYYGSFVTRGFAVTGTADMAMEESAVPMAKSSGAAEFSQTNVQVKGVDEADFVKNDDKYIYTLSQDKLLIVDVYPAEDAEILSETEIEGIPRNMFVNDDRLVIFSVVDDEAFVIPEYDFVPRKRYAPRTHAFVYDISDRKEPILVNDFNVNGQYYQARMIGDYIYFIAKDNVYYQNNYIDLPVIREGAEKLVIPDVYYFDNPETNFVFHTIAAFSINKDEINAKSFLMGYSNNLMVSKDNIYISYQKNVPWRHHEQDNKERFYEVIVPLLPGKVRDEIEAVKSSGLSGYEKWEQVSSILEDMYNNMDEGDKEDLVEEIEEAVEEYELKKEIERRKTIIHKIAIDGGDIDYIAKGEVEGYLLNQFSMDEFESNLRVATTTEIWARRESRQYNNVYVLDGGMEVIGELEEIAPDESIYSTRFIGERLYMVTFKRIDPFFVIDLSRPEEPEILGQLKIPGFSDYLHSYDENHIIGIGKETADNQWGGTSIKGVKVALFDVSDVSNPEMIDKYEIGDSGTDSEALREHKALLFDRGKNILVLPIRKVKGDRYRDPRYGYYRQKVWQGAYVLGLTPEDGIELKGMVSHYEDDEDYRYYWGSPYAVRRSLYMDDVLYTISAKKILANSLEDLDDELAEIDLPYKQEKYYPVLY
ncbi:copper amine oxidase [Candidatus Woesearchaeota archaeon]|nr:copper amine oxidase [Candidatus Woesearchaeota archaeon]